MTRNGRERDIHLKDSLTERRESRWRPIATISRRDLPASLVSWLLHTPSLTRRLRADCCDGFRVRVLSQNWRRPLHNERIALGMAHHEVGLVREVHLLCRRRPWVFARTVIPLQTMTGSVRRLARLGAKPLGGLLFADPSVRRGALEIARIAPGDSLYDSATGGAGGTGGAPIWGRRSVFHLDNKPLLVSEIFLSEVGEGEGRARA
jgi:chorismate--pyruvate lyase